MPIWNKYKIVKEIHFNSNIKTYLTRIEPIVKEIIPSNKDEYYTVIERLENLKNIFNIYEIIEENEKIYLVIDNNEEISYKLDKLLLSDELDIKKEAIIEGHGAPISKEKIYNLFKMEKSMCKITFETLEGNEGKGTGFFCELDNFPIKYALFTNNHVLDNSNIEIGNTINFEYLVNSSYVKKEIKLEKNRKVFTDEALDYTCVELLESDNIKEFFKIDPKLFKYEKKYFKNNDIFILQYPGGNDISFSYGKILLINENIIKHSASTDHGSSGSPIIRRCKNNYIIGLHHSGFKNKFNLASIFDSILNDINKQYNNIKNKDDEKIKDNTYIKNKEEKNQFKKENVINCIYIPNKNEKEINLLHDYNLYEYFWGEEYKKEYLELKNLNKKLFEENIDLYINDKKIKFDFKYKTIDAKEIKVKFIFKTILTNTSFMFYDCSFLKSIDLSSFNTNNINNMSYMFNGCYSLKSINLSSVNTNNVKDMRGMFSCCSSLKSIDLSSFNTNKVKDMRAMFSGCAALESINFSSFNTNNVKDMSYMFSGCHSLKKENIIIKNKNDKLLQQIQQI